MYELPTGVSVLHSSTYYLYRISICCTGYMYMYPIALHSPPALVWRVYAMQGRAARREETYEPDQGRRHIELEHGKGRFITMSPWTSYLTDSKMRPTGPATTISSPRCSKQSRSGTPPHRTHNHNRTHTHTHTHKPHRTRAQSRRGSKPRRSGARHHYWYSAYAAPGSDACD